MHDETRVRMRDRIHDLPHQGETLIDADAPLAAPARDRFAIDIFKREIRPAACREARVVKRCDVRMVQARENVAFAREPLAHGAGKQMHVRQLERDRTIQLPVNALGEPDDAHAAGTEFADETIDADLGIRSNIFVGCRIEARTFQIRGRHRGGCVAEDAAQPGALFRIARLLSIEPRCPFGFRQIQGFIEQAR